MTRHNFAPAGPGEAIVHGACRPGYNTDASDAQVDAWLKTMQDRGIVRVCCLLDEKLACYDDLLNAYRAVFGADAVCSAPVEDFTAVSESTLTETIWPFLCAAEQANSPVVVHCSAGMGRTGQILALWLAVERDYGLDAAIRTVKQTGRAPIEAASRDALRQRLAMVPACDRVIS